MFNTRRNQTRFHNISVLESLGYGQVGNTTVFCNNKDFILSPAVSESRGGYWFDIREVNLKRMGGDFLLLVRIVPDKYILASSEYISPLLTEELKDNRPHSGQVWGIKIGNMGINSFCGATFFNVKNRYNELQVNVLDKDRMIEKLKASRGAL